MPLILTSQTHPVDTSGVGVALIPITLNPGVTGAIDTVSFTTTAAVKWLVTERVSEKVRFFEVSATCHTNHPLKFNLFGDVGDRIDANPDVSKQPGEITLSIINNEASDVVVSVVRLHATTT